MRWERKNKSIDIVEVYSMRVGALWKAFRQENASLWMLCIYFFFEYVRPQTLYPVIDILPWAQIFLIASIVTAFLDRSTVMVSNVENKLFVMFLFIVILSSVFSFRLSESLDYWEVMSGWALVYFLVITIVNTEQRLLLFLIAYSLFNLKMAQHGAIAWAMRGFSFASYGLVGSPGWFRNSGEYAIQMLIFGPLAISLVISLKEYWGRYTKWFLYACAATGYMAVIGASSRGAQIALVVVSVWFLLKQKNGLKGFLIICVVAVVLYYLMPEQQMERFREMGNDRNSLQRLVYWKYALEHVIPNNPVLGVGYNNWLSYVWLKVPEGMGPLEVVEQVHNIFLQATAELGFSGLISFLLLVIYAFVNNARTRKISKECDNRLFYNLAFGLDAGLIGFLVAGCFVTVLYYPFFWIQIAMIVTLNNVAKTEALKMNSCTLSRKRFA